MYTIDRCIKCKIYKSIKRILAEFGKISREIVTFHFITYCLKNRPKKNYNSVYNCMIYVIFGFDDTQVYVPQDGPYSEIYLLRHNYFSSFYFWFKSNFFFFKFFNMNLECYV